ncbi:hypothetical protein [Bacillus licheniformis]|uniref:hypothetical protein n=1 Tax=Bacillus licheniformis TaxID=1402 RepID=UPI00092BC256|nr:hypothetical protein [Bacillus licheniformis]OJT56593.1 hypothetical protein BFP47_15660 [Bacillus licheniformis]OJT69260.1 hypothetical protein BFP46_08235 [Bacillus licheniformis]
MCNGLGCLTVFGGALCGALMSGITAIYVMHRDIAFRKKDKRMEKNNNFKKSFELIRIWTNSYLQGCDELNRIMLSEEASKKKLIAIQLESIKECSLRLNNINDDYIPEVIYKDFLDLKALIELTFYEFKAYEESIELFSADNKLFILV